MAGFVTDNVQLVSGGLAGLEKLFYPGKNCGFGHARAIDSALHLRPIIFAPGFSEKISHIRFIHRDVRGDPITFARNFVEQRVVGNNGVIEIDPNDARRFQATLTELLADACRDGFGSKAEVFPRIFLFTGFVQKFVASAKAEQSRGRL